MEKKISSTVEFSFNWMAFQESNEETCIFFLVPKKSKRNMRDFWCIFIFTHFYKKKFNSLQNFPFCQI